ncbi:NADPH:quinone reductase [Verrucomicrobiota bacterium sgz303538]
MKAIRVEQFGGPEVLVLAEVPDPQPGPEQILIRVHTAGVNPVETYIRAGNYARLPTLPYTPGHDGAGVVEKIGTDVRNLGIEIGDRVYLAGSITGTYAEKCLCEPGQIHPLPDKVSFAEGAALGVPYPTAFRALFQRGDASARETVLIHGGTGGVGLAAVQCAIAAGLKVFATGGTESGKLLLTEQGAHAVFDHHELGYCDQIIAATHGRGVDLIIEMLANVNLGKDLGMLAKNGRVVVVGSRNPVEINPRDLMSREADIRGVMLFNAPAEELAAAHREIRNGLETGVLRPIVERQFALGQAPEAHEAVLSPGAHGKIVLTC